MIELLAEAIERKARGMLERERSKQRVALKYADKFEKRTGLISGPPVIAFPRHWAFHPQFNPIYCIKNSRYLARTIWAKLLVAEYRPVPAVQFDIPKPTGGTRTIMAFAIADAALANLVHARTTKRNLNLMSSMSYAYRPDRNVFDALIQLHRALGHPKSYIVQYDFSKYFDTIDHDYIRKLVNDPKQFIITKIERTAIEAFLGHSFASINDYPLGEYVPRTKGVPQGSSLSLFLSNIAAHELDSALEKQNGMFVRFADDVVSVTHSHTDAMAVAEQFRVHCKRAGLAINYEKSPGITLFDRGRGGEHRTLFIDHDDAGPVSEIKEFNYLGHKFSDGHISLSGNAVKRIKRQVSKIIYIHLLLYPRSTKTISPVRLGPGFIDWDLVTCINEIRKYVYGGLSDKTLTAFLDNDKKMPFVRGLMAFYPLITEKSDLTALDGWLLAALRRAYRERLRVLASIGVAGTPIDESALLSGSWYTYFAISNETVLPSFVKGYRAARKHYMRFGLSQISPPSYYSLLSLY